MFTVKCKLCIYIVQVYIGRIANYSTVRYAPYAFGSGSYLVLLLHVAKFHMHSSSTIFNPWKTESRLVSPG